MAIAEYKTGSATISTTEYSLVTPGTTLASDATDGVYQIWIDASAMLAGDEYWVRVKEKVTSAGAQQEVYFSVFEGAQASPFVTPTLILMHGWDVTVQRISGSDRTIAWSIRQVA